MNSVFHGETDFDGYLPVLDLPFDDVAASFNHVEPASTKKADVIEHPKAFDHVGLLVNEPPGARPTRTLGSLG